MKKTTRFKQMLTSPELEFICEAHNGLSAKIAEEAGFKGLWGSGLSISAAMGVRDNNEASWTQVLEVLEFMADQTKVPILLDADTGYGNFNNMRRLVQKLEQRDIAAACIEDKIFPKTNSFIKGEAQPLAEIDEFCGKIKAGKDAAKDDDFCIVARTEAFISGWGLEEALKRCEAYRLAGADAVLVHSKLAVADEIFAFMKEWDNRLPVVIVPTKYYATPTDLFREAGISLIIWANHNLRTAINAMKEMSAHLFKHQSLAAIEKSLPTVEEIFRLQGMDEYEKWEKAYLPKTSTPHKAVLLAASRGSNFGNLTADRPKAMLEVEGKPVISHAISAFKTGGIRDVTVVTGYKPEAFLNLTSVKFTHNAAWEDSGEVGSLMAAKKAIGGKTVIGYGDVVVRPFIIENLIKAKDDITVVVDYKEPHTKARTSVDWTRVTPVRTGDVPLKDVEYSLVRIDDRLDPNDTTHSVSGEWIGLVGLSEKGAKTVLDTIDALAGNGADIAKWTLPHLINHLIENGVKVGVQYVHDNWIDIDDITDLSDLYKF
jgi:phosphoenolpyruvate phosphomutase